MEARNEFLARIPRSSDGKRRWPLELKASPCGKQPPKQMTKTLKPDTTNPLPHGNASQGGRIPRNEWPDVVGMSGRMLRNTQSKSYAVCCCLFVVSPALSLVHLITNNQSLNW